VHIIQDNGFESFAHEKEDGWEGEAPPGGAAKLAISARQLACSIFARLTRTLSGFR
jgi:hypothetical protein